MNWITPPPRNSFSTRIIPFLRSLYINHKPLINLLRLHAGWEVAPSCMNEPSLVSPCFSMLPEARLSFSCSICFNSSNLISSLPRLFFPQFLLGVFCVAAYFQLGWRILFKCNFIYAYTESWWLGIGTSWTSLVVHTGVIKLPTQTMHYYI